MQIFMELDCENINMGLLHLHGNKNTTYICDSFQQNQPHVGK